MLVACFHDLSFSSWEMQAHTLGLGPLQRRRIFRAVYAEEHAVWDAVKIPAQQLRLLRERYSLAPLPTVLAKTVAADGTVKFLLGLTDGRAVESVYIPEGSRGTVCLSSQVGCAMGCTFCFTAQMELERHLRPSEIVGQWRRLRLELPTAPFTNIVFMGMGEPLHNLENVLAAIDIFTHDFGLQVPVRRITISTSGLLPGIRTLLERTSVRLALSVNGSSAHKRLAVMPVEKAYPIVDVLGYLRTRPARSHHAVMFEYVLLGGVNDAPEDADALLQLLQGVPGRINLIPFNPHPGSAFVCPTEAAVLQFHARLRAAGRHVFIRRSRGREVLAACGQLYATRMDA